MRAFTYDEAKHEYRDARTGQVLAHATGVLLQSGWVDDRWYTDYARFRGSRVHKSTQDYDLGLYGGDPLLLCEREQEEGYLRGYIELVKIARPVYTHVEIAVAHATMDFACRPDRRADAFYLGSGRAIVEIKSGAYHKAHPVQTALQAICAADNEQTPMRPEDYERYVIYLQPNGRAKVEEHTDAKRDFNRAWKALRDCGVVR